MDEIYTYNKLGVLLFYSISFRTVHISLEAPPTTTAIVTTSSTCNKCGSLKSGKSSCCARGGAWFKKCGNPGDSKFDHTWFEGIQACKSEFITVFNKWDT